MSIWKIYDVDVTIDLGAMARRTIRIQVKAHNSTEAYQSAKSLYPAALHIHLYAGKDC